MKLCLNNMPNTNFYAVGLSTLCVNWSRSCEHFRQSLTKLLSHPQIFSFLPLLSPLPPSQCWKTTKKLPNHVCQHDQVLFSKQHWHGGKGGQKTHFFQGGSTILQVIVVWIGLRAMILYRVSQKEVPPFDSTRQQNDNVSGLFEFMATFVSFQLKCTYLAFGNPPPNTGDMSSQGQHLECTWNQRFWEMA